MSAIDDHSVDEILEAKQHLISLSPERKEALERDWQAGEDANDREIIDRERRAIIQKYEAEERLEGLSA